MKPEPLNLGGKAAPSLPAALNDYGISDFAGTLSARFTFLRLISESENARLYLASDNEAGQSHLVRLKVFTGKNQTEMACFMHEARASAKLSHPNIVRARPPEQINGVHFAIIEYCAGVETLKELLTRKGWLSLDYTINLISQICDAFDYAHNAGVLHLRIGPESVLVDRDGNVRIDDFGAEAGSEFAWAHAERSRHCPAQFLSPEQVSDWPVDHRSDLYSLGILIYNMVVDRLPFDSERRDDLKHKILTRQAVPPHLYSNDVPLWLSSMIVNLIEKKPERRFQSVAEVVSELERSAPSHRTHRATTEQRTPENQQKDNNAASSTAELASPAAVSTAREASPPSPAKYVDESEGEAAEPEDIRRTVPTEDRRLDVWEAPTILAMNQPAPIPFPINSGQGIEPPSLDRGFEGGAGKKASVPAPSIKLTPVEEARRTAGLKWVVAICLALIVISGLVSFSRTKRAESEVENRPPVPEADNSASSVNSLPVPENSQVKPDAGREEPLSGDPGPEKSRAAAVPAVAKRIPGRTARKVSKAQSSSRFRARKANRKPPYTKRGGRIWR